MVLPKTLENMLKAVSEDNSLLTWSIYQLRDGTINFKLKFNGSHSTSQDSGTHIRKATYRRQSDKQAQRDLDRSRAWNSRKQQTMQSITTPKSNVDNSTSSVPVVISEGDSQKGVITRAMARHESVELARSDIVVPEHSLNPHAESFIFPDMIADESVHLEENAILSPELSVVENTQVTESLATLESSPCLKPVNKEPDCESDIDSDFDSSSDLNDCHYNNCSYEKDGVTHSESADTIYRCTKCGYWICKDCVLVGRHKRHKKYIVIK